ncbi:MAG TPA: pitrilysin family protein [Pseudomonadota bacterium]|nr:pitrilysin family protein [Pseudomonadota bacterium]
MSETTVPSQAVRGADYLLEENHDLPLCRVQLTLRTGAETDVVGDDGPAEHPASGGRGIIGQCNFATELWRRGAGGRTRAQLDEEVDRLGATLQVLSWHDQVVFEVAALTEKIDAACGLLADVLLRPEFPLDEAERLRRELHASLDDMRDDDSSLMHRFFARALYGDHPYGRPVGGTAESIDQLSVLAAQAWHRHYLKRGNLVVGAAGDLKPDELESLLSRHFTALPDGPRLDVPLKVPPPPRGLRVLIVDKPERTQSQILIGHLAPAWRDPSYLPLYVATTAFGGTFTARLMDEVRSKRGLSYGASARVSNGRGVRAFSVNVFPSAEQTAETIELVLRLISEWAHDGLRPGELEFAQSFLQKNHAFSIQTPEDRLGLRTRLHVCDMPLDHVTTFPARVAAVTPEQARQALAQHIHPQDLLITLVATAKTVLPSLQAVPALRDAQFEVVPYDSY